MESLQGGCHYAYFVRDDFHKDHIQSGLSEMLSGIEDVQKKISFVQVPEHIQPFCFCPPFEFHLTRSVPLRGIHGLSGPNSKIIDTGVVMEQGVMSELFYALKHLIKSV